MSIFECLSEHERVLIRQYIKYYGYTSNDRTNGDPADLSYILRYWNENKEELFHMFGDKFIVSRPVSFSIPFRQLQDAMSNSLSGGAMRDFYLSIKHLRVVNDSEELYLSSLPHARLFHWFLVPSNLAENSYCGDPFEIALPDGKNLRIETGCKPVKMLGKIAKAYGLMDSFEKFRIEHSQILNQKKLTGTMCLSIHPLDYMTMSDNNSDWTSCMSWFEDGCYRRGTVECMNSKYAVVAYLKGSEDMDLGFDNETWNNKKWRSLFIVHDDMMTNVKGYPYSNHELDGFVLNWLKELKGADDFSTPLEYEYEDCRAKISSMPDLGYRVSFETCDMYNDFGTATQVGVFSKRVPRDNSPFTSRLYINYSGPAVCIHCGASGNFPEEENELCCCECSYICRCCDCGEPIEETYELDGENYCSYCYNENAAYDCLSHETHHTNNMVTVSLLPDGQVPEQFSFSEANTISTYYEHADEDFLKRQNFEKYLLTDKIKHYRKSFWTDHYFLYVSDLTKEGLELFDIYNEEELQEYCESFN